MVLLIISGYIINKKNNTKNCAKNKKTQEYPYEYLRNSQEKLKERCPMIPQQNIKRKHLT